MSQTSQITSEIKLVTPLLARNWLENFNNPYNRKIHEQRVKDYTNRITKGEWMIGDALKFDNNGILIDGQHRLSAVIQANKPTQFLVLKGFDPNTTQVLDRGMLRTLGHVAQLAGHQWITTSTVAVFNNIFYSLVDSRHLVQRLTDEERIKAILSCKDGLELANYNGRGPGKRINNNQLKAVVVRAFYSDITPFIYYKATRKRWNPLILKDFLRLVQGHTYCGATSKFSQTELNYSAPCELRTMFLTKSFSKEYDSESEALRKLRFKCCESALYKYLSNSSVKQLRPMQNNLFPVSWIDDLSFDNPKHRLFE